MQLTHKGLIQLWSIGSLTDLTNEQGPSSSTRSLPRLRLGIAHDFGCIRAMKGYPHASGLMGVTKEAAPVHLGVLALACSDGCVRVLEYV